MKLHDCEQGSDEWFALRAGIPTGSNFGKLVTSTGEISKSIKDYAYSLVSEKYASKRVDSFAGNVWTEAGKEDEDNARSHYWFTTGNAVSELGFVTDDDVTHGVSPDGLVGEDGLLELKRLKGSKLVEAHLYYKKHNKLPPLYVQQTQGQMMVMGRKWCDVMLYNPALPSLIIRVTPDDAVTEGITEAIKRVGQIRDETLATLGL
jgi:hypothetical protein